MDAEERELREILHGFPRGGEQMDNEDFRRALLDVLGSIDESLRTLATAMDAAIQAGTAEHDAALRVVEQPLH